MPNDPIKTCGYHGTLMDRAENIRVNGFNKSDKSIEWLGFGIYFFDSFINAKQWAIQEAERQERSSGEPAVLVVNIKVRSCDFLDLDKRSVKAAFMRCLEDGYKLMFSDTSGGAPNFRDDRELRCFWCNYYTKTHPNINRTYFSSHTL